jgi:hypothetical protein
MRVDGTGLLTTKIGSGAGGYPPGKLILSRSRILTVQEAQLATSRLNASGLWHLPSYDRERAGADGAEWVIEAAAHGQYHLVSQWSPKDGPIRDLGEIFLFKLARIDVPKAEIY